MKKYLYIYKKLLLIPLIGLLTSCDKFLDVNIDPTLTSDATIQQLLPTAEFYTSQCSYRQAYVACQYSQQIGGVTQGGTDAQLENENATGWSDFYLNVLPNLNLIVKKGSESNAPAYVGIAKVLTAYNLGLLTVNWENVPFSQADQRNFAASYDTQESVYASIQKLLDEGITELGKGGTKPSTDDLVYAGDLAKWTKLAYSLKARYAMHLSKKGASKAASDALGYLAKGMTSSDDDFQLIYNSRNLGPWYSNVALANNTGNLTVTHGASLIGLMTATNDPRLPIIATLKRNQTTYNGVAAGKGTGATVDLTTTAWHSSLSSPIQLMTFAEVKAIEAEARFISNGGTAQSTGTNAEAYKAYLAIAEANMTKLKISSDKITAYLANPAIHVGASKLTMAKIIAEKYKAMFLIGDIWTDLRRYDYIGLSLPEFHNVDLGGKWIQRMKYPSSEINRNEAIARANFKAATEPMWMFK